MSQNKLVRTFLLIVGTLSLILGVIGIFVPLLPTTSFLLLSAYCYFRSSKRLYHWLINHKVLGGIIYYYLQYKAIPLRVKVSSIIILWLTLIVSILWLRNPWITMALVLLGSAVSIHVISLKTLKKEEIEAYKARFVGEK